MSPYRPPYISNSRHLLFPCRKCLICRIRIRNEWTTRMIFESFVSGSSFFVTLTYSNDFLPNDGMLSKRDLQLFLKRLRKRVSPVKIRYFACGEYGERFHRPHYHLIIWNLPKDTAKELISDSWNMGIVDVKEALPSAFRYVAGYVVKKYSKYNDVKEFTLMSRRPGIGFGFLERLSKYRDESGTDVVKWFYYEGKKFKISSYCLKRMRMFAFDEDYRKELSEVILDEYQASLLTTSYEFLSDVSDESKRIQLAIDKLKQNVVSYHRSSNISFLKRSSIYQRKDKL